MVRLIERAHALSATIRDIPIPPYLQVELDAMNIMRAIRGTTAIEGADVSTQEVREIMKGPAPTLSEARQREEQEVRNAQDVMFYVAKLLGTEPEHPLTEGLICELHERMTRGLPYENNVPGEYRSHRVTAGDYVPPESGDDVRRLMREFIDWLNTPPISNWDPILRALAAHFYVVSIHPFGDGNGRTSRAIESFMLYQGKINARGFYSLANYYYQNRSEYVWHLDNARFNSAGDLTPYLMFCLSGLVTELQDVHTQVIREVKFISFRDYARQIFQRDGNLGTKAGERLFHFLIALGRDPLPLSELRTKKGPASSLYRNVSYRTMQRDIALLRERELIRIEDGAIVPNVEIMEDFTAIPTIQWLQAIAANEPQLPS
jgi:Fic family protein